MVRLGRCRLRLVREGGAYLVSGECSGKAELWVEVRGDEVGVAAFLDVLERSGCDVELQGEAPESGHPEHPAVPEVGRRGACELELGVGDRYLVRGRCAHFASRSRFELRAEAKDHLGLNWLLEMFEGAGYLLSVRLG